MDLTTVAIEALYDRHLPVGASDVRALVCISASGLRECGVNATLRLWTPLGVTLTTLRELSPLPQDLRGRAIRYDEHTAAYPAGCWTNGAREYQLVVALPPRHAADEMLATRVSIVIADAVVGQVSIAVTWTDDERLIAAARHPPSRSDTTVIADLPTDQSPRPRHTLVDEPHAARCPACALPAQAGDRYCERCGHQLLAIRSREA
jgi:hypothetical protein